MKELGKTAADTAQGSKMEKQPSLFAVMGNSRESRRKRIEAIAHQEPCLGFLAALFDFEWMIRRAILALSTSPTPDIRSYFVKKHGWDEYKKAWKSFVKFDGRKVELMDAIESDPKRRSVISGAISDAFQARHPLVHGANGFIKDEIAYYNKDLLLAASDALELFLKNNGKEYKTAFVVIRRLKGSRMDKVALSKRRKFRKDKKAHEERMNANGKKHLIGGI